MAPSNSSQCLDAHAYTPSRLKMLCEAVIVPKRQRVIVSLFHNRVACSIRMFYCKSLND